MTNTPASSSSSERQQLLGLSKAFGDECDKLITHTQESVEEDRRRRMTQARTAFLLPVAIILFIPLVWLAFTGFVVVPPGELAVIVTLV